MAICSTALRVWGQRAPVSMATGSRLPEEHATELALGTIDLPAAFLAKQVGEVLPDGTVSDVRGLSMDESSLSAQRGKWLLIEFWGFW